MTRKILLLVLIPLLAVSFISCEDIQDNTPAFQVMVNGELFKASEMQITTEDDGYMLTGIDEESMLNIYLTNIAEGSYSFSQTSRNVLTFSNPTGKYTTAFEDGSGELLLTGNSAMEDITGTFYFIAADTSGARMHGSNGQIYQLPFGSDDIGLPGDETENEGEYNVNGNDVNVINVQAVSQNDNINIEVLGENDTRIAIQLAQTIEVGTLTLPSTEATIVYFENSESYNVVDGVLEIEIHDNDLGLIKGNFQVETEESHQIEGSFQVIY